MVIDTDPVSLSDWITSVAVRIFEILDSDPVPLSDWIISVAIFSSEVKS